MPFAKYIRDKMNSGYQTSKNPTKERIPLKYRQYLSDMEAEVYPQIIAEIIREELTDKKTIPYDKAVRAADKILNFIFSQKTKP